MAIPLAPACGRLRLLRPALLLGLLALLLAAAPVRAQSVPATAGPAGAAPGVSVRKGSGLPVPRFAALRSDQVNVRSGPGTRYPVDWEFHRKFMPVEVIGEFENWRRIRDWQGAGGWVHQSLLTGRRYFVVTAKTAELRKTPSPEAEIVAHAESEVIGEIRSCQGDWCRVRVTRYTGWVQRAAIWGGARRRGGARPPRL
jgi:SH3-like domain-containing protein